jgi:hypothetical protein
MKGILYCHIIYPILAYRNLILEIKESEIKSIV